MNHQEDARLRGLLEEYLPEPSAPHAEETAFQTILSFPPHSQSAVHFVLLQAGFIRKRMWVLQLVLFALLVVWISQMRALWSQNNSIYALCACTAPLLVLINVTDFVRVYHVGLVEVELATRYSLPKIIAARMLIFGVTDIFIMVCVAAVGAWVSRTALLILLLYCLTPFCLVCAVSMELLRHLSPSQFTQAVLIAIGVLLLFLMVPMGKSQFGEIQWFSKIYADDGRIYWLMILAGAMVMLGWQIDRLHRGKFDFIRL